MKVDFFKLIPELKDAVDRETARRDAAFLDIETNICGVKIRQMTPEDYLILDGCDNPIVCGQIPNHLGLAEFIWRLAVVNKPGRFNRIRSFRVGRKIRKMDFIKAVTSCRDYMAVTFQDAPCGSSGKNQRSYASWIAHLVDIFGSEYGWDDAKILKKPLRRLFQLRKCIVHRHDPDSAMSNPSDRLIGDYLRILNKSKLDPKRQ